MDKAIAVKAIALVSFIGLVFAAYMTYTELSFTACPASGCSVVAGIPACIYGLVMYLVILMLSLCVMSGGMARNNKGNNNNGKNGK